MDFKVHFPDLGKTLVSMNITSLNFSCDVFSLYNNAVLVINDFAKDSYNEIRMGMKVDIVFIENTQKRNGKVYVNHMRVLKFEKIPGKQELVDDSLVLNLVSSWYFINSVKSVAYLGNVGKIIGDALSNRIEKDVSLDLLSTTDIEKIRYQTSEKTQDFVRRILKYGLRESLPIYLYNDAKGTLKLRGISDFIKAPVTAALMTITSNDLNAIPSNVDNLPKLKLEAFKFISNGMDSASSTTTKFTIDHFRTSRNSTRSITLTNNENNNVQSGFPTPNRINFKNWNLTPDDALAISSKENFEANVNTFGLTTITPDFNFNEIDLGNKIHVVLPYEPVTNGNGEKVNLGEGDYFIRHIDYIYENKIRRTKMNLIQISYK